MNKLCASLRLLTAAAVLVLIALCCWQCIDIYITGMQEETISGSTIFSMPIVADRLSNWAPVFYICLGVIVISSILHMPLKAEKRSNASTPEYRLKQLKSHFATLPAAVQKEESHRHALHISFGLLIFLLLIPALVYLLDVRHFTDWNLEAVLASMLLHTLPWFLLILITALIAARFIRKSVEREIHILSEVSKPEQLSTKPVRSEGNTGIRYALFFVALLFIVLGIMNGGLYDVLVKAINICTECIGLG